MRRKFDPEFRPKRRFRCLTRPDKRAVRFPDLLKRDFGAPAPNLK